MFWKNWNYNVGHDTMIEDKFNSDLIAFLSPMMNPVEHDIIMIYNPSVNNEKVTQSEKCYEISQGEYQLLPTNVIYIQSNS